MHVQAEVCRSCGINCNPVMIINVKESLNPSRSLQQMMQSDVKRKRAMLSSSANKHSSGFGQRTSKENHRPKKQQNPSRRLASLDRIRRNKTSQLKTSKLKSKKKTIFNQSVFSTYHRSNTTLVTRNLIMTGVVLTFSNSDLKHDYLHFSTKNA